ncbi:hypothetical protein VTO42DRAFT_7830 [Malbranchea cinnamomea]
MEGPDDLDGLRGLFQDLSSLSRSALPNVERLVFELEAAVKDFRKLLDKRTKSNESRQTVLSGKVKLNDEEFSLNQEFQQEALQVADALDVDEIEAVGYYMRAQQDASQLDRTPVTSAIIRFHERRSFLLECLRLVLSESFELEREGTQAVMLEVVAQILEIQNAPLRNASLFTRKCLDAMTDIEKWLVLLGEQVQKAAVVGQAQETDIMEVIEWQRHSLGKQHESLGAILHYLFKGGYASSEDLRKLLEKLQKIDKFDSLLVHYVPAVIASFAQYGSPEGQGQHREARSLHEAVTDSKESRAWKLSKFHSAVTVLWLAEFAGWYFDSGPASPLQGIEPAQEASKLSKMFMTALDDGAFEFILEICASMGHEASDNIARNEIVGLLLKDGLSFSLEPDATSPHFRSLLMECVEVFIESLIANMPDAIRMLKSEEDLQRLDQITALREGLNSISHRGLTEARMHLESLLVIIAFAFEGRPDAAQEFWDDPDGNLHGFLHWASKRQTVPRVSAFCEMLCSISEGEENSLCAHKFLLDEEKVPPAKLRRSTTMSWTQMFAELQLYTSRATERPSATQPSLLRLRKPEVADIDEPESPVMLSCYLRLISHLCKENHEVRAYIRDHPTFNLIGMLLTLCNAPIPNHLRAAAFVTLRALIIDRTTTYGNEVWVLLDQWTSGYGTTSAGLSKSPPLANPPVWIERNAFQKIAESFDQTRAFVELLNTLVCPAADIGDSQLSLSFPESLGSSYRMPGVEPYVDFVMDQAFASRSVALESKEALTLQLSCLDFVVTCLQSFNENLVSVAVQQPMALSSILRSSSISVYVRLHPFYRVMEWLFNEDVLRTLFAVSHQDVDAVGKASSDSVLVRALVRSIEVMNMIVDHQATYFDLVRLRTKTQSQSGSSVIASSSLASFEDSVMDNLHLIIDLCLYCGSGHPELTLASLALLEKLAGSRKLNKSPTVTSRWQPSNQIVELLNYNADTDRIARVLTPQISTDVRELESGPESAGSLIKVGLLNLLDRCLKMISDKPSMAHLLLGFSCVGNSLDIPTGGLLETGSSLFHAVVSLVQNYPEGDSHSVIYWMIHLKRLGFQLLQRLWASPLSSGFVLPALRLSQLLRVLFTEHPIIGNATLWDNLPITDSDFWCTDSARSLCEFLAYRGLLFEYATTELRSASRDSSPSLQNAVLGTLLGSSTTPDGVVVSHPSLFELFDFADLDIVEKFPSLPLTYFGDLNIDICARPQENGLPTLYDEITAAELLQVVKDDMLNTGKISPQEEEQVLAEIQSVLSFIRAKNHYHQACYSRYVALKAWTELATTIVVTCDLESTRMAMFILQVLQVILPKLEQSMERSKAEAFELARLAETLISKLDTIAPSAGEDVIEERMYSLFQTCLHNISLASEGSDLRQTFYHICTTYLARITRLHGAHPDFGQRAQQTLKSSGSTFVEIVCDDAYSGNELCRVSALLFLNVLAVLERQQESSLLVNTIVQSNYLGIFLDVIRSMASEFRNTSPSETPHLLVFYEAQLALLLQLSQTRLGAMYVLEAGLFQAVKDSQLFAVDPDIGLDIENPDALRKYYDLLLSVIRVIISAVFSRGLHNQQVLERTRQFLSENRQGIVGIFKRHAKIGVLTGTDLKDPLDDLVRAYIILITAVEFLEYEDECMGGSHAVPTKFS